MEEPADCWLCHRHAEGLGIGTAREPKWLCKECSVMADGIRSARRLDAFEVLALTDAGADGGAYLDGLGKTDLAELTEHEYREFVRKVVLGFGASLRQQIREKRAPF
ncbi:MAG: hypothetical protein KF818_31295 [Chelatococcus sp.]|nr:hypothetical protein [Chelatococcus sp. HY11]MBX3547249.1 hypothetical protein [Chelatococcus sp.]